MDLFDIAVGGKLCGGGGGDTPTGTKEITANGMYDVKSFASASVSVPTGVFPSGTKSIAENGIYDVTDFASASVSVPIPSYSTSALSVTENGTYSVPSGVDGYNPVTVNVSGGGGGDAEDGIIDKTLSGAYTNSRVSAIGNQVFASCSALTAVSFPNVQTIGNYAFNSCSALTTASFPNVKSIGNSVFYNCSALTTAIFPNATYIGTSAFGSCGALTAVSFPNVQTIGNYAFNACVMLTSVVLLNSSVASLSNANAFNSTPISRSTYTGSFGSIYVPASLVDSYKSATNWSTYASRITSYVE